MGRLLSLAVALAVVLAASGAMVRSTAAPDTFDPRDQRRLFAVRDTNAALHAIEEARRSLAKGQALRGLRAAQRVLDDMTDDFFLQVKESKPASVLWSAAPEVVRELLANLTPEQRAAYERFTAPSAAPLLADSLRRRDEHGLREVLRRYGASRSGVRAAVMLASLAAESGRWRDAARYLREGLRYAPRTPALWTRLFTALVALKEGATLTRLRPPVDLKAADGIPLTTLRDRAVASVPKPVGFSGWPMWGGIPSRDAQLPDATPMPNRRRWHERTDWQERGADRARAFWGRTTGSRVFREMLGTLRAMHPVMDGRTVYVSDGRTVRAHDLYSGRRLWSFDAEHNPTELPLLPAGRRTYGRTSLDRAFSPVVAGDLVLATVEVVVPYHPEYLQGVEISTYLPHRVLVAFDKRTGQVRWHMTARGLDRLTLEKTSIVSPVGVAEGLVLAVGASFSGNHSVAFLAFDARTGVLRWRRPLGYGQQELNLFGYPLKELAASPVTIADGVAYASTGLGFVAAVDIRSGVPRWLASYEIIPVRKVQLWYDAPLRTPKMAPAPPVVHGDTLIVCPTDGLHVHAFDRHTGRLLWRQPYETSGMLYDVTGHFLGVAHDGKRDVVLLTDSDLRARDLATGAVVWRGRFDPEHDRVIGQGAVAGESILVPTQEGVQRFRLRSEGAYQGTVPWPEGSDPGNLLPLGRVLLVTGQRDLQWFYDWATIERDVARRRLAHPDDPTILLEAGEMYLRGDGETERARKAFEEARLVARRAHPELEDRAIDGLYATWLREGEDNAAFPEEARKAFEKALGFARTAEQRVRVRMRLHVLLAKAPMSARIANAKALVAEAGDALGVIFPGEGRIPARAAALFLLAGLEAEAERPSRAIDVLQQVLREEHDAPLPSGTAGERAQALIGDIIEASGPLTYRQQEQEARALLARAIEAQDPQLLDRILREYPNAAVVTDTLLEQGKRSLAQGQPLAAATALRRLLHGAPPKHPLVPTALAALTQAYREAGARGAARAALDRLATRYAATRFTWQKASWTGATFQTAEHATLGENTPDPAATRTPQLPLVEVQFEPVGDEEYPRPLDVATDASGPEGARPAPVALMMSGRRLVAIDLRTGRVAWRADVGSGQRAAWVDGVLVIAANRELAGYDAATGKRLWTHETTSITRDLQVKGGLVFALFQDLGSGTRGNQLVALDAYRGTQIWRVALPRSDYRNLTPWGERVLLRRVRYGGRGARGELIIFDAFDGRREHALSVPLQVDTAPVVVGNLWCVASTGKDRRSRVLTAYDIVKGRVAWQHALEGSFLVGALVVDEGQLLVLQQDGRLTAYALEDGTPRHTTRIYVGEGGNARPFPGTPVIAKSHRVTFLPWVRRPSLSVVCYDRRTGKLKWEAPYEPGLSLSKAALDPAGDVLIVMIAYRKGGPQHLLLRLIDAETGKLLQVIEPENLAREQWVPTIQTGYGTVVIFGKTGASILRAKPAAARGR